MIAADHNAEPALAGTRIMMSDGSVVEISSDMAAIVEAGGRLCVVPTEREILPIPVDDDRAARIATDAAIAAFAALREVDDAAIASFFLHAAERLSDPDIWSRIAAANEADVEDAEKKGRATGRLRLNDKARAAMIEGLRAWGEFGVQRNQIFETIERPHFFVDLVKAPLGVVAFVFEGRPNVVIDACGLLLTGNSVVFRIGSDARGTARALIDLVVEPALLASGLPEGAVSLVDSASRASGWALFSDTRIALAIARGSGQAAAMLGAIARQNGIPVSLHGRGGAWLFVGSEAADAGLHEAISNSLDRKVCNTLNTCCIPRKHLAAALPVIAGALESVSSRSGGKTIVHVLAGQRADAALLEAAEGVSLASLDDRELGYEWEWDAVPEISLLIIEDLEDGVRLFNRHSPRFIASLLSNDRSEHDIFFRQIEAPFVGDALTRWVDGQFALEKPELGLSNWESGRLLGRSGILAGDSVYTIRTLYRSKKAE